MRAAVLLMLAAAACDRDYRVGALPGACIAARDTRALAALTPDARSHWLQPWQAFTETLPAERMRDAIGWGIFATDEYAALGPRLAEAGLRRVTIPTYWSHMDMDDPTRLSSEHQSALVATFAALRQARVRPQVRLFSLEQAPCPQTAETITLVAAAPAGTRTVRLDGATAARVRPGRTALTHVPPTPRGWTATFITAVMPDGTATLSKPLPSALEAGAHAGVTLRFPPFPRATLADGTANPAFATNVQGWLDYAMAIARLAREGLGDVGFDLLIGNEIPRFFDAANTYDPPPDGGAGSAADTARRLVAATIERLGESGDDWSNVGLADSFGTSERAAGLPDAAPANRAIVRSAISGPTQFAPGAPPRVGRPIDALGEVDGSAADDGAWREAFTPRYDAYFPELPLTAIDAGTLVWDLLAARARGASAPAVWLPSVGLTAARETTLGLARDGAAQSRIVAKTALRSLASFVAAGASTVHLYGPIADERRRLLDPAAPDGGESWAALRRFSARFGGTPATARRLSLVSVAGCEGTQFQGDGTAAHPDLHDRNVVAFFPFQASDTRFVVPTYVMTRDVMRTYRPDRALDDPLRYVLPDETFTLVVAGVDGARVTVSLFDPVNGGSAGARVIGRAADRVTIELALTDYPRLLEIEE